MYRFVSLLLTGLFLFSAAVLPVEAAGAEPIPVVFRKQGGGQFIYCNNPEFIKPSDLSTDENPNPTYMMKNEGLAPGKYSVFFCFYNWTDFDVEPDIELLAHDGAEITITAAGYCVPKHYEYWDCLDAAAGYFNTPIRKLNGYEQFVPAGLPGETGEWASQAIANYEPVPPHVTFNMLVDFTIEGGTADVNLAALKSYGDVTDRSHHVKTAAPGKYVNDTAVKGIDTETLPVVEADLNVTITPEMKNGENLNVEVFNQFYPDGSVVPNWVTNINPARDEYAYSKKAAAGSDMLELTYRDDSKLAYYGKNVPQSERSNVWNIDIYHKNTLGYEAGMGGSADDHVPNAYSGKTLDPANPPNLAYEFNIGNFGVTNRYRLSVTNTDAVTRSLNYYIEGSIADNVVMARDLEGNLLNPYTLARENAFALAKGIHDEKKEDCLFSVSVAPGETKQYLLDVYLPTNNYGGETNILRVDDHNALIQPREDSVMPEYCFSPLRMKQAGAGMVWQDGTLVYPKTGSDNNEMDLSTRRVKLPEETAALFAKNSNHFKFIEYPGNGYAARFSAWDGYDGYVNNKQVQNKVYLFGEFFGLADTLELPDYIYDFTTVDGELFVLSDRAYKLKNGAFIPVEEYPVSNGTVSLQKQSDGWYFRDGTKISFESGDPEEIIGGDRIFYTVKSWKSHFADSSTPNIIAVSPDGIRWHNVTLPEAQDELRGVYRLDKTLIIERKYDLAVRDDSLWENDVLVKLNGEYLVFSQPVETRNDRTMVPMRFFFEKLQNEVFWNAQTEEISVTKDGFRLLLQIGKQSALVNGEEVSLDSAPYISGGSTMIPLRFLSESLGYRVEWDEETKTAEVTAQ